MKRRLSYLLVAAFTAYPTLIMSAAPAHACANEVCEAVNKVCNKVTKSDWDCLA